MLARTLVKIISQVFPWELYSMVISIKPTSCRERVGYSLNIGAYLQFCTHCTTLICKEVSCWWKSWGSSGLPIWDLPKHFSVSLLLGLRVPLALHAYLWGYDVNQTLLDGTVLECVIMVVWNEYRYTFLKSPFYKWLSLNNPHPECEIKSLGI